MLALLLDAAVAVAGADADAPLLLPAPSNSTLHVFVTNVRHYMLHNNQMSLIIAFSLLSLAFALYTLLRSSSFSPHVSRLYIYPIKGCAPIALTEAHYDRLGFRHDRRWMLVRKDEHFNRFLVTDESSIDRAALHRAPGIPAFLSQRSHPRMALMQPRIDDAARELILAIPGQPDLHIPFTPPSPAPTVAVKLWADVVLTSVYTSPAISSALTAFLGQETVLVTLLRADPQSHHRPLDERYDPTPSSLSIHAPFSDGYPFLLTTVPSLAALNAVTPTRVTPMVAFRPNIVVDGPLRLLPPWDEDYWKAFAIDTQRFHAVKPCDRCAVPTVHPDTGERDPLYEPIQTMREQRAKTVGSEGKADGKVYFGMNVVQESVEGVVRVGDLVRVTARRTRFIEQIRDKKKD